MEIIRIILEVVVIAALLTEWFSGGVIRCRLPVDICEEAHPQESKDVVDDDHQAGETAQVLEKVDDDADENPQALHVRHDAQQAENDRDVHHAHCRVVLEDDRALGVRKGTSGIQKQQNFQNDQHEGEKPLVNVPDAAEISPQAVADNLERLLQDVVENEHQVVVGQAGICSLQGVLVADLQLDCDEQDVDDGQSVREIGEVAMADYQLQPLQPPEAAVEGHPLSVFPGGLPRDKVKDIFKLLPIEALGRHGLQLLVHLRHLHLRDPRLLQEATNQVLVYYFLDIVQPGTSFLLLLPGLLHEEGESRAERHPPS